jgi:myo-inositol-1(or 4)-monophosphatase
MQIKINPQLVLNAVKEVGKLFLEDFRKKDIPENRNGFISALKSIEEKSFDGLKQRIDKHYPQIPWVDDDEFDADAQSKPANHSQYWLCDTMDGAIQYLQHINGWTINLVLIEHGIPYFSVIYDPLSDELFWAIKNQGAFLNGKKIQTSNKISEYSMLVILEYGHQLKSDKTWKKKMANAFTKLLNQFGVVRNYGPHGLQLAYIGAGRIDLFLQEDLDTHNWLAGMLIAKEAGAEILTSDGKPWQWGSKNLLAGTKQAVNIFLN